MRKFDNIIMSSNEPRPSSLWLKDGELYFYEGGWKPVKLKGVQEDKPVKEEFGTKPIPGYSAKLAIACMEDAYITKEVPTLSYDTLMRQGDTGSISINTLFTEGIEASDETTAFIHTFGWFFIGFNVTDYLGVEHPFLCKMRIVPEYGIFVDEGNLILSDYKFKFSLVDFNTLKWTRTEA